MMTESDGKKLRPPGEGRQPTWDEKDEIIMAAERGDINTLVSMSHKGIDVTAVRYMSELHLLHIATNYGHRTLIQVLLNSGAPVDVTDANHWTPLHVAAWRGFSKSIQILCEGGAMVDAKCDEGRTPLHIAAANDRRKAIEALVNAGATLDIPDKYGHTPLTEAVRGDLGATAMFLINKCKANRSEVPVWYQDKLRKVLKKEEERIKELANQEVPTPRVFTVEVQPPSERTEPKTSGKDSNNSPEDDIDKSGDVRHPLQCNIAETIPGGIVWSGVTCSAGLIGYVIGDDIGVFTGALCAIFTGMVSIDVLQWGYRTFINASH